MSMFILSVYMHLKYVNNVSCHFKLRKEELDKRRRQEEEEKLQKMKNEKRELVRPTICTLAF